MQKIAIISHQSLKKGHREGKKYPSKANPTIYTYSVDLKTIGRQNY